LYAPSKRKGDAELRGRFNVGEKLGLALCESAEIISTRGGVRFDDDGRHSLRTKREFGSSFTATIRFTQTNIAECEAAVRSLIVPSMVTTTRSSSRPTSSSRVALRSEWADHRGSYEDR
jgi:hypothetical protein